MRPDDLDAVIAIDHQAAGCDRGRLLKMLADAGRIHVLLREGAVAGYAVSRLFGQGYVVGPVVADDLAGARQLIEAALSCLQGCFVRIDTAAVEKLSPWLAEIGLAQVGNALTMVKGDMPPTGRARIFALASQSFN